MAILALGKRQKFSSNISGKSECGHTIMVLGTAFPINGRIHHVFLQYLAKKAHKSNKISRTASESGKNYEIRMFKARSIWQ